MRFAVIKRNSVLNDSQPRRCPRPGLAEFGLSAELGDVFLVLSRPGVEIVSTDGRLLPESLLIIRQLLQTLEQEVPVQKGQQIARLGA